MKDLVLIIWLTQLGLSVALPPVCFTLAAFWLRDSMGWGDWVIWIGVILGVVSAVNGLRDSLKAMERLTRKDRKDPPPPVSFNDHD